MITPLKKISLSKLQNKPIMFDANIFMVGIEERNSNKNCSFENMKELYIKPLFECFKEIYIHEEVYKELDDKARAFVDSYLNVNVKIVREEEYYTRDPLYVTIFNNIASHELVRYSRGQSKDRGEVYSMAYAAYHGMNYFCSKEIMVDNVAHDLEDLKKVNIITFDIILLSAYVYYAEKNNTLNAKALKSMYKKYCADVIKRHQLPKTFGEYVRASAEYL